MSPRSATASPGVDRVACVVDKSSPVIAYTVIGSRPDIAGSGPRIAGHGAGHRM
jgi:hypothetical protein